MLRFKFGAWAVVLMLAALSFGACSDEDDDPAFNPPSNITEALKQLYPAAQNIEWEMKDVYYVAEQEQEQRKADGKAGPVRSENNDGYSVSYVVEQTDGQTAEEAVRRKAYDAVYMYLLPTGWLNRKVRCHNDHKCGYYGL